MSPWQLAVNKGHVSVCTAAMLTLTTSPKWTLGIGDLKQAVAALAG